MQYTFNAVGSMFASHRPLAGNATTVMLISVKVNRTGADRDWHPATTKPTRLTNGNRDGQRRDVHHRHEQTG